MTVDAYDPATTTYTISGTGPYTVDHAYDQVSDLVVEVIAADGSRTRLALVDDYSVNPPGPATAGDLTLTSGAAAAHAGATLEITRTTSLEQGWAGSTPRENALEAQLDRTVLAVQEARRDTSRSLRIMGAPIPPLAPEDGRAPIWDQSGGRFRNGPTADEIANAQGYAADARNARDLAQAWAENPEDDEVAPGMFSALHHAAKAAASDSGAAAALADFLSKYLGVKTADPTTDNNGDPLEDGATYFNSATTEWKVYSGGAWGVGLATGSGSLLAANNLSDLPDVPAARANLALVPQAGPSDNTAGRLLTPGAFGLGNVSGFAAEVPDVDAEATPAGMWRYTSASVNKESLPGPLVGTNGYMRIERFAPNYVTQTVWRTNYEGGVWTRVHWDTLGWQPWRSLSGGQLINVQIFDTAGAATYTPTPGTKWARVMACGATGAGAGANSNTDGSSGNGGAGGGAAGATECVVDVDVSAPGYTADLVLGAGGAGANGANGSDGGESSYDDGTNSFTLPGSRGGTALVHEGGVKYASGGARSGPTITGFLRTIMVSHGEAGGYGFVLPRNAGISSAATVGGTGGGSALFGGGTRASTTNNQGNGTAGANAARAGEGGSGGSTLGATAAVPGGNGHAARFVIHEYSE